MYQFITMPELVWTVGWWLLFLIPGTIIVIWIVCYCLPFLYHEMIEIIEIFQSISSSINGNVNHMDLDPLQDSVIHMA